jgi:hypothetical protein
MYRWKKYSAPAAPHAACVPLRCCGCVWNPFFPGLLCPPFPDLVRLPLASLISVRPIPDGCRCAGCARRARWIFFLYSCIATANLHPRCRILFYTQQ